MAIAPAFSMELSHEWTVEGFKDPESAAIDLKRNAIYVSNVNAYALDGNGFISRVSLDGRTVEWQWVSGVNSPTGVAVHGERLYFADVNALVVADLDTGNVLQRIPAPDAAEQPVLNDVAVSKTGDVYVTGSRSRTIYKLENDELAVWLQDDHLLESANGLLVDGETLIHGGERWTVFDLATKSIAEGLTPPSNLRDFDGIMHDGEGGFITTTIDDDRLWQITPYGSKPVSEEPMNGIDMDLVGIYLALPRVGGKLTLYRVIPKR